MGKLLTDWTQTEYSYTFGDLMDVWTSKDKPVEFQREWIKYCLGIKDEEEVKFWMRMMRAYKCAGEWEKNQKFNEVIKEEDGDVVFFDYGS